MKRISISALTVLTATASADAVSRYDIDRMSCASVTAALRRDSPAVLSHTSRQGLPIYNLYVGRPTDCRGGQISRTVSVPAADGQCRVLQCYTPTSRSR
jgi:hypothetical protein